MSHVPGPARGALPQKHSEGLRVLKSAMQHIGLCWVVVEGGLLGDLKDALPYNLSLLCRPICANSKGQEGAKYVS